MSWEGVVVSLIVGCALVYVLVRTFKEATSSEDDGCASGCGCSPPEKRRTSKTRTG